MLYPHSTSSLAETAPSWNGRAGNHMKSNHYGQELAGFRVLCVLCCYALLYRRQASCSRTEGGWQSRVIEADRASGGWPSRALLAPGRDCGGRVDTSAEELLPSIHRQALWRMTLLIWVARSSDTSFLRTATLPERRPWFLISLFHPLGLQHVSAASLFSTGQPFDHFGSNYYCNFTF